MRAIALALVAGVLLFGAVWAVTGWADEERLGTVTIEPRVAQEYELEREER